MKYLNALLLFVLLGFLAGCAGENSGEAAATGDAAPAGQATPAEVTPEPATTGIPAIKAEYSRIQNGLGTMSKKEAEYDTEPFGGKLTGFYEQDQLVKVVDEIYGDHGPYFMEYFYKDGKCFFAFEHYEYVPMVEKAGPMVTENRWYLEDGKLLQQLQKDKTFKFEEKIDMSAVPNKTLQHTPEQRATEAERIMKFSQEAVQKLDL